MTLSEEVFLRDSRLGCLPCLIPDGSPVSFEGAIVMLWVVFSSSRELTTIGSHYYRCGLACSVLTPGGVGS